MIDRASSKHGPHLDEKLAEEVEPLLRGRPNFGRVEEWREPEPAPDGEPEPVWAPPGHHGWDTGDDRDPDRREARARIASYLPRGAFPAYRDDLVVAAAASRAPDEVIDILSKLDPKPRLETAHDLWVELGLVSGPRFQP